METRKYRGQGLPGRPVKKLMKDRPVFAEIDIDSNHISDHVKVIGLNSIFRAAP